MGSTKLRRIVNYDIAPKAGRANVIYITERDVEHFSRSVPKAQMANNLLAYLWYTEQPKITKEITERADKEIKEFMEGSK